MDLSKYRLTPAELRWRCDPDRFTFTFTHEIEPPGTFIGQERAVKAVEFGLGVNRPGYNIFVTGLSGTGKNTVIRSHLRDAVEQNLDGTDGHRVYDWCYVFNFRQPDQPEAISLEPGRGQQFAQDIADLQTSLSRDVPAAFDDDAYKSEIRRIAEEATEQRNKRISEGERVAQAKSFTVQVGPGGIAVVPLKDGKPMDQSTFMALSDEEQEEVNSARREVAEHIGEIVEEVKTLEASRQEAIARLDHTVVENVVASPFAELERRYAGIEDIQTFLQGLREYALSQIQALKGAEDPTEQMLRVVSVGNATMPPDPLLPFRVNLFVDNSAIRKKQIVVEDNPTYPHLFGQIERRPTLGTYITDHTMLRAGSLVRASGGYLVLEAREVLSHPAVWPALKRVMKGGEVRPEDPADIFAPGLFSQGLRPKAIPIDVKIIMSGEPEIYSLLATYDPEFWEIFKVRADLDHQTDNSEERVLDYSRFICGLCNQRRLRHFTRSGVASIVEHGARMVESQNKLSTRFGLLADLVVEASEYAVRSDAEMVTAEHVEEALEQRIYRSARVADTIRELMLEGTLIVALEGEQVGQANGLSVYSVGDFMFGRPSRITARAYMGQQGVINVEREVQMGGPTHDKGVMILSGYLGEKFAQKFPLSVNLSIAFEQSYGPIDGDSASSTELYAILSSLADLPIRQDIAITGSINQMGDIQPIGGANEKVEGFFDLCEAAGRLGTAGVLLPHRNMKNLMLRQEVVDAVNRGEFHVYAVKNVNEGIEILTGVEAGERGADGQYSAESVNGRAQAKLKQYAEGLRQFLNASS